MIKSTPTLISVVLLFVLITISSSKILQLTQKNLPNVLKTQPQITALYHHPDCSFSTQYKTHYFNHHSQSSSSSQSQIVGIIDCSLQHDLCQKHKIKQYPHLRIIYQNMSSLQLNSDIYLGQLENSYKNSQQYRTNQIVSLLKQQPNFVVVMFEEQGMPVSVKDKPTNMNWRNRVFYFNDGKLSKTIAGFVKNKPGCWILQVNKQINGQLKKHYCGDTYQSLSQLKNTIQKFINQTKSQIQTQPQPQQTQQKTQQHQQLSLIDSSNYQNDTILGYKQLSYQLKHYNQQLQLSTYSRVSICNYLYLWTKQCQHCNYQSDMKVIKRIIQSTYKQNKNKNNQQKDNNKINKQINYKYKIYSYDISNNKIINKQQIILLTKLEQYQVKSNKIQDNIGIIPNIISICFNTDNNRNLQNNVRIDIKYMEKIIAAVNIRKYVQEILREQGRFASSQGIIGQENKNKDNEQL